MLAVISSIGGLKAICQNIGLFFYLEEKNIEVNLMAGNSGGAIALAFINVFSAKEAYNILKNSPKPSIYWDFFTYFWDKLIGKKRFGFLKIKKIRNYIKNKLSNIKFKDLKIPFYTNAYNLNLNMGEIFSPKTTPNVLVSDAILASSSIPILFDAYHFNGSYYWDGGIIEPAPLTDILLTHEIDTVILVLSKEKMALDKRVNRWLEYEEISDLINYYIFNRVYEEVKVAHKLLSNVKIIEFEVRGKIGLFEYENIDRMIERSYYKAKKLKL